MWPSVETSCRQELPGWPLVGLPGETPTSEMIHHKERLIQPLSHMQKHDLAPWEVTLEIPERASKSIHG